MKNIICYPFFSFILFSASACNNHPKNTAADHSASSDTPKTDPKPNENSLPKAVSDSIPDSSSVDNADDSSMNDLSNMAAQLQNTFASDSNPDPFQSLADKMADRGKDSHVSQALSKLQSMMKDSGNNPGDAISNSILNLQMAGMKDDNPLKQVAQGEMAAEKNGTALPGKTYTAAYKPEQPADYTVPVSGSGAVYELQYTGGVVENGEKNGLWRKDYVNTKNNTAWNVSTEAYMISSAIKMKVHSTSLSNKDSAYVISFNAQYQKYNKEKLSDKGKYESDVRVQKIATEKMFGFNCVHIRISYTVTALHQTAHLTDDEWYSNEVPGAQFLSPLISENHAPALVHEVLATGCAGALVKFKSSAGMLIQLTSITKEDMPDSLFTLPVNYQLDKNTGLYGVQ